jgi:hypothetical protein
MKGSDKVELKNSMEASKVKFDKVSSFWISEELEIA